MAKKTASNAYIESRPGASDGSGLFNDIFRWVGAVISSFIPDPIDKIANILADAQKSIKETSMIAESEKSGINYDETNKSLDAKFLVTHPLSRNEASQTKLKNLLNRAKDRGQLNYTLPADVENGKMIANFNLSIRGEQLPQLIKLLKDRGLIFKSPTVEVSALEIPALNEDSTAQLENFVNKNHKFLKKLKFSEGKNSSTEDTSYIKIEGLGDDKLSTEFKVILSKYPFNAKSASALNGWIVLDSAERLGYILLQGNIEVDLAKAMKFRYKGQEQQNIFSLKDFFVKYKNGVGANDYRLVRGDGTSTIIVSKTMAAELRVALINAKISPKDNVSEAKVSFIIEGKDNIGKISKAIRDANAHSP